MARIHYWQYIVDEDGRPISGVEVDFYTTYVEKDDPGNVFANIYANSTVGHQTTTDAIDTQTNQDGYFEFWVGDEWETNGGYTSEQRFTLTWWKSGMTRGQIDNIDIYPPTYEVDETAAGQEPATEAVRRNKLISNRLAYTWEDHVEQVVPTDSPHDILPVVRCSTDDIYNKVVSNELINQIFTLAVSASTVSLDASGADIDNSRIPIDHPWQASGSLYYADVTHNLGNLYPVLQIAEVSNTTLVIPETVQSLDVNTTRVVFSSSAAAYWVTAIG